MTKRILAMLLVLVMVLSCLPVGVIAEGTEATPVSAHGDESHICAHCKAAGAEDTTPAWTAWDGTAALTDGGHYVLQQDVTVSAPVALTGGSYVLCLNGKTVTGATTLFELSGTAGLVITDCTAKTENEVYRAGKLTGATTSAVRLADKAKLTVHDGIFTGNTNNSTATSEGGGAIHAIDNSQVEILGGQFSGNTSAKYGGAIFARNYAKLSLKNVTFTGNESQVGGALYGTGAVEFTLTDVTVTGNTGTHTSTSNAGYAAAVYMSGSGLKFTVSGKVIIADNIVTSGNVKVPDLELGLEGCDTLYVNALAEGSRIVFGTYKTAVSGTDLSEVIAVSGTQTEWNSHWVTYKYGDGATELVGRDAQGKFSTGHYHDGHLYSPIGTAVELRDAAGYGYLTKDLKLGGEQSRTKSLNLCLNGHTLTAKEGKRLMTSAEKTPYTLVIEDCTASTDEAGVYHAGTVTGGSGTNNGGLFHIAKGSALVLKDGILTGNTSLKSGGVIQVAGTFTMEGGRISGNKAATEKGTAQNAGAIIVNEGGVFTMEGGTISQNEGANGGAVYVNGTMQLNGGTIEENTATAAGGAIYAAAGSTVVINGGQIANNTATSHGGGVYCATGAALTMAGGAVEGNTSGNNGGGIYLLKLTADITGGSIAKNTAAKNGGGLYMNGTVVNMDNAVVSGNSAVSGGGLCGNNPRTTNTETGEVTEFPATVTMGAGVKVTDNTASDVGGGIYAGIVTDFTVNGAQISGNHANTEGGGIYTADETVSVKLTGAPVIDGNTAGEQKSNLHLESTGMLQLDQLVEGTKVGISASVIQRPISNQLPQAQAAWFVSDSMIGAVIYQDGMLYLKANTDHVHCACNGADQGCGHTQVEYIPWDRADALPASGNYYLTTDVQLTKEASVTGSLNLCLNGHTITAAENKRILSTVAGDGLVLSLSDCTAKTEKGVYTAGKLTGGNEQTASGGAIYLRAGSTLKLYDGMLTGNVSQTYGGAVSVTKNAAMEIYGGEVSGNSAVGNGGGIYCATDSGFTMLGGSIKNNISENNGGGLYVLKQTVILDGGEISGNSTAVTGGGIYANGTVLTLGAVKITGNSAASGAGIYANNPMTTDEQTGEVTQYRAVLAVNEGADITGNTATSAGGGIYLNASDLTVNGGRIAGNKANIGGGTYVSANSTMTLEGGTVESNASQSNGGGIYVATGADFRMLGGTVKGNSAGSNGGGIYLLKLTTTFEGGEVSGNQSTTAGGGLYFNGTTVTIKKLTVSGNKSEAGAGIYGKSVTSKNAETGKDELFPVTIKLAAGAVIKNNNATKNGGGILITGREAVLDMPAGTISGNYGKNAGGVLLMGKSTMKLSGGSISGNSANSGGGIYVSTDCKLNVVGGSISGNTSVKNGGGIYMLRSTGYFSGGAISGNKGESGGGLYVSGAKAELQGTTFSGNTATKNGGAAMITVSSTTTNGVKDTRYSEVNMTAGAVTDNTAINAGGILVQSKGCVFNLKGGSITQNTATSSGGGVYVSTNGTFTMSGGEVSNNTAVKNAGGVNHYRSIGTYTGGKITGNMAATGGGMTVGGGETCNVTMEKGLIISGNTAERAGGGILVQGGSKLHLDACEIADNTSGKIGGGLCISSKTHTTLKGTYFHGNTAKTEGGGVYVYTASSAIMEDVRFEGNHAVNTGGGIFSRGRLAVTNGVINGNTCDGDGGGIGTYRVGTNRISRNSYMTLDNTSLENNTAGGKGGGLYLSLGHPAMLTNVTLIGNTSVAEGGAVWSGCDLSMDGMTATGNTSGGEGYAVYLMESGYDGESYIRGVLKMCGDTIVRDNPGGDMYLGERSVISIPGGAMGENAYVHIQLASGVLTQQVLGSYNYEGGNQDYIITHGSRSMTEPEQAQQSTDPTEGTDATDATEPTQSDREQSTGNGGLIAGAIAIFVALIAAATAVIVLKNRKKNTQE